MLEVRLLGQFDMRQDGYPIVVPSRSGQSLLAYLLLNAGYAHRREMLAGLLWPDSTESNARSYLRHALWRVRKAIGDDHLTIDNISIAFNENSDYWLDVSILERGLPDSPSIDNLLSDVSVYAGEFLPGFYDEWVAKERDRLQMAFEHKMDFLLAALVRERRWREVQEWGEHWIAHGHAPEPAFRALMIAQGASGNLSGVAVAYQRCVESLRSELGVEPSDLTQATFEALSNGEVPPGASTHPDPLRIPTDHAPDSPPTPFTPFVGRQNELATITNLLGDPACRLLTLVGPGGIGKTRLAIEVTESINNNCTDICWVSLAPVASPELLTTTIAGSFRLSFTSGQDSKLQLLNYLRNKELLLILDSFEHLLDGAGLVAEILQAAPHIKIIVTTRERLNLHGEWLFEVGGLEFPTNKAVESKTGWAAVALFVQNARRIEPGFSLSVHRQPFVIRICQMVEGNPLAIELASSWLTVLSCEDIAKELEADLDFLEVTLRDVPERHRSLRAVFDHSWRMLSNEEREVFKKLSVFRGGFSGKAARHVAGATLTALSALSTKSFLRRAPSGRLFVHQTLLQYGGEKLSENTDTKVEIGHAHCQYCAELLERSLDDLQGQHQHRALAEIEAEIGNIRAAWHWAIGHRLLNEIGKMLDGFYLFYELRGWFQEGEESIEDAVELARALHEVEASYDTEYLLGKCLARQGLFCVSQGRYGKAKDLLSESLVIMRRLGKREELAFTLGGMGSLAWDIGEPAEAVRRHKESLAIYREVSDRIGAAQTLSRLGFIHMSLGKVEEAERYLHESLAISSQVGNRVGRDSPLSTLGWVSYVNGNYQEARQFFLEGLTISNEFGNRMTLALNQAGLSMAMNALGHHKQARQLGQESLTTARDIGYQPAIVTALVGLGDASRALGDCDEAWQCFREGFEIALELKLVPMLLILAIGTASLLIQDGKKEFAAEILSFVQHNNEGLGAMGKVAEQRLSELANELQSDVFVAARERGKARKIERIVEEMIMM
jgi:predicted ATPase/DNA-binding SARP family transcriptional activator